MRDLLLGLFGFLAGFVVGGVMVLFHLEKLLRECHTKIKEIEAKSHARLRASVEAAKKMGLL